MKFNSKEYNWNSLKAFFLGRLVTGIRGVEYKKTLDKEALYAMGGQPRAIQHKNSAYEGTITLLQSEVIALNRAAVAAGYKDCTEIEFDIVVSYAQNGVITTDRIVQASITEDPRSFKQGDAFMEIALPFIALDVEDSVV
jgi:hypothetical protein